MASLFAVSVVVVVVIQHGKPPPAPMSAVVSRSSAAPATPAASLESTTPLVRGPGTESPELRALIDREYELSNSPSNPIFEGWEVYHHR